MKIKVSELKQIIKEEALSLRKINELETEKAKIVKQLNEMYGGEVEEGIIGNVLGTSPEAKKQSLEKDFVKYTNAWRVAVSPRDKAAMFQQAAVDGYKGKWGYNKGKMFYKPLKSLNLAAPTSIGPNVLPGRSE